MSLFGPKSAIMSPKILRYVCVGLRKGGGYKILVCASATEIYLILPCFEIYHPTPYSLPP